MAVKDVGSAGRESIGNAITYYSMLTYYMSSCIQAGVPLMLIVFGRGECGVHGICSYVYPVWHRECCDDNKGSRVVTGQIYEGNDSGRFKFANLLLIPWVRLAQSNGLDCDGAYQWLH